MRCRPDNVEELLLLILAELVERRSWPRIVLAPKLGDPGHALQALPRSFTLRLHPDLHELARVAADSAEDGRICV